MVSYPVTFVAFMLELESCSGMVSFPLNYVACIWDPEAFSARIWCASSATSVLVVWFCCIWTFEL